jgi:tetratricopeptide (TPR) repeat protein
VGGKLKMQRKLIITLVIPLGLLLLLGLGWWLTPMLFPFKGKRFSPSKLLDEAITVAQQIKDPQLRDVTLAEIAQIVATTGDTARVDEVIRLVGSPKERDEAWGMVAVQLADAGQFEEALARLQRLSETMQTRQFELGFTINETIRAGAEKATIEQIEAALELCRQSEWLLACLLETAYRLGKAARTSDFERLMKRYKHLPALQAILSGALAHGLARAGNPQEARRYIEPALKALAQVSNPKMRSTALNHIVPALVYTGQLQRAKHLLQQYKSDLSGLAFGYYLEALARTGYVSEIRLALETLRKNVKPEQYQLIVIPKEVQIAYLLAEAGKYEAARQMVNNLSHGFYRVRALAQIAKVYLKRQRMNEAKSLLSEAKMTLASLEPKQRRLALSHLIEPLVATGDVEWLWQQLQALDDGRMASQILKMRTVLAVAQHGHFTRATGLARQIEEPRNRARALAGIAACAWGGNPSKIFDIEAYFAE